MLDITPICGPSELWDFIQKHSKSADVVSRLGAELYEIGLDVQDYLDYVNSRGLKGEFTFSSRCAVLEEDGVDRDGMSFVFLFGSEKAGVFLIIEDDKIVDYAAVDNDTTEITLDRSTLN